MPVWERRALFNLLIKQRKLEEQQTKEAQGDTQTGGGDLMRMPLEGEVYGKSDIDKLGPPKYVARFLKGEQRRQEAAKAKD